MATPLLTRISEGKARPEQLICLHCGAPLPRDFLTTMPRIVPGPDEWCPKGPDRRHFPSLKEGQYQFKPLFPVRMSPFVRALNEKRLPAKVLYNGAWTEPDQGGAA